MCTGTAPFKGKNTIAILSSLALDNPPPPASLDAAVPAELSDLVMRLLAKKPEQRPESARSVVRELQEIDDQTGDKRVLARHKTPYVKGGPTGKVDPSRRSTLTVNAPGTMRARRVADGKG